MSRLQYIIQTQELLIGVGLWRVVDYEWFLIQVDYDTHYSLKGAAQRRRSDWGTVLQFLHVLHLKSIF